MWRKWHKISLECISSGLVVRNLSNTNPPPVLTQVKKINKNVRIVQQATPSLKSRPLVLLFGWLFAKPKHLAKFGDMYVQLGFDVITVQIFLPQLLRPKQAQSLMRNVLDICMEEKRQQQEMIVHCLSVGGYMYGEVLTNIESHPEKYDVLGQRLRGQIFDSVIDFYGIPHGIARAATQNETLANKIEVSLKWYLATFKFVMSDYIKASQAFHDNKLRLPSIFVYSKSDPVCNPEHFELLAADWRKNGIVATSKFWNDAPHVCTFRKHREEYTQTIIDFIRKTGINADGITENNAGVENQENISTEVEDKTREKSIGH